MRKANNYLKDAQFFLKKVAALVSVNINDEQVIDGILFLPLA
jgi:hypothetical protein